MKIVILSPSDKDGRRISTDDEKPDCRIERLDRSIIVDVFDLDATAAEIVEHEMQR